MLKFLTWILPTNAGQGLVIIAAMMAAQLLFTYSPLMNRLFHTAPVGVMDWVHIVMVGLAIHVVRAFLSVSGHREQMFAALSEVSSGSTTNLSYGAC